MSQTIWTLSVDWVAIGYIYATIAAVVIVACLVLKQFSNRSILGAKSTQHRCNSCGRLAS
jgi:hypothetical protein